MSLTITDFDAGKFDVSVTPWATDHGCFNEDGERLIGETFLVWVTATNGRRWQHERTFGTTIDDSGDYPFITGFDEAKAKAEALATKVAAALRGGARLDIAHWQEIDPAYGSEQYVAQGIEAERCYQERNEFAY